MTNAQLIAIGKEYINDLRSKGLEIELAFEKSIVDQCNVPLRSKDR